MQFSEGLVGPGRAFFQQAVRQAQEGIMAMIIGWQAGVCGLRGLLVAAPWSGRLRYVATVRTGFTDAERRRLPAVLAGHRRARQVVPCPYRGLWLEPELMCQVNYLEWTRAGRLRGASFHGMLAVP